jgi:RNA polymerase sigma-70 factor, ECF subfamily
LERRLVDRAIRGDEEAFGTLIERYGPTFHAVARRILDDPLLAEDATQQAMLAAWRFLPQLREPDQFEAWAYRLVVNACRNEARRERRHRNVLRLLPSHHPSTGDAGSRVVIREQLETAFRALSIEHRTVVVLVHYAGMTPSEAARAMGTPTGTARSRLHYALEHMRAAIEADARIPAKRGTA